MDELSKDLMRGAGGLEALNGGLDGDLEQWAEGEAIRQAAGEPDYRSSRAPAPMPPGAALLVIALLAGAAIILLFAAL